MACRRNVVFAGLTEEYNARLKAAFGVMTSVTRDVTTDPSTVAPLATPFGFFLESSSRLLQDDSNSYQWEEVSATLIVRIMARRDFAGDPQSLINEVESVLDSLFDQGQVIVSGGIPCVPLPDGDRNSYPGAIGESQLEYPVKVQFPRQTAQQAAIDQAAGEET